jgi:hypothetical protein
MVRNSRLFNPLLETLIFLPKINGKMQPAQKGGKILADGLSQG